MDGWNDSEGSGELVEARHLNSSHHPREDGRVRPVAGLWRSYQQFACRHEHILYLVDETVSRLLFWTPNTSRWREAFWGLLELHRLLLELAKTDSSGIQESNSYGTSVAVTRPDIPATSIRLVLTLLQSLGPVAQELVVVRVDDNHHPNPAARTEQRQAVVRKYWERIRFVLRTTLLMNYWRNMNDTNVLPGLLLNGGLYHTPHGFRLEQERSRLDRLHYVGRHTGRRVVPYNALVKPDEPFVSKLKLLAGELLYILRPLIQAETHNKGSSPVHYWFLCLVMDVLSLLCLHANSKKMGNAVTAEEWNRRRLRLWIYLLRVPVWERYTERTVQGVSRIVTGVPLAGGLLNNYLWDWIDYWRYYRAEEG